MHKQHRALPISTVPTSACADRSGMNFEPVSVAEDTPVTATECAMVTLLLCSNVDFGLLTGMVNNRPSLLLHSRLQGRISH